MQKMRNNVVVLALVAVLAAGFVSGASAAIIFINNVDGVGEGFNDATPAAPVGGNPGTTVGQQRLNAFQHAANLVANCLESNVVIVVNAKMDPQTCTATSAVLGSTGANFIYRDFPGAPFALTWYCEALANALAAEDLGPTSDDMISTFNSNLNGAPTCLGGTGWYYGFDGLPGSNIDFVAVVLHELFHGLGFQTFHNLSTGAKLGGFNDAYLLKLARNAATPSDYPTMTNAQRAAANRSDPNLIWTGADVTANSGSLTAGKTAGFVRCHGPATLALGSSVSHFSTSLLPNELMEPNYSGPNHDPGLALNLLIDIGWPIDCDEPVSVAITSFEARPVNRGVQVSAKFASTLGADYVVVYRAAGGSENFAGIASVDAPRNGQFVYVDESAVPGKSYAYQIGVIDADGEFLSPKAEVKMPNAGIELSQNTPNPFNPTTMIRFSLPASEHVSLSIYSANGTLVRSLVDGVQARGTHNITWDGRDSNGNSVGSGVYFYRLTAGKFSDSKKMVLLK